VVELGEKAFRADQLSRHYFVHHTADKRRLDGHPGPGPRERLATALFPTLLAPARELTCDAGTTHKERLWRLFDGALVESVVMRYPDRITVCVSSQGRLRP